MSSPHEISRIRKESFERAVSAVRRDDVDALKNSLDVLPEFNSMMDRDGRNLLTLSCEFKKKKVFDYLLNLNCFDLEAVDGFGHNALMKAILYSSGCDYYCVKLINAGTDVFKIFRFKGTYLHHAMYSYLLETAKLLLQKGLDPNAQDYHGYTSLHMILEYNNNPNLDEGVGLLLEYGADTAIYDNGGYLPFDYAVTHGENLTIQEHLFYCTFDCHSADYKMQLNVFRELMDAPHYYFVSPLFDNVMDVVSEVNLKGCIEVNFFTMPPDLLKKIIKRRAMNINNLEILLNSELHFETVELISKLELSTIYSDNYNICREKGSGFILYLLSYGLNVTSDDCQMTYLSQGHSEFFKTMLLHLNYIGTSQIDVLMVRIIIDIHCDLNTILARFYSFEFDEIEPLLDYFANSELRLLCERTGEPDLINRLEQLPTVPSLLQLARDETRKYIVRRYNLMKTSQYYWVLRRLKIGRTYEEILSFETKLYA